MAVAAVAAGAVMAGTPAAFLALSAAGYAAGPALFAVVRPDVDNALFQKRAAALSSPHLSFGCFGCERNNSEKSPSIAPQAMSSAHVDDACFVPAMQACGGKAVRGAAAGLVVFAIVTWLRRPPAFPVPPRQGGKWRGGVVIR